MDADSVCVVWKSILQKARSLPVVIRERLSLLVHGTPTHEGPSKRMLRLLNQPVTSSKQRLEILRELASEARLSLQAVGVEICLYDKESKMYRQSLVAGTPFSDPIDEMLGGDSGQVSQSGMVTLVERLHFAGEAVGVIRASFRKAPTPNQERSLKMYAQYANLTIVNSNFIAEIQRIRRLQDDSLKAKTGFLAGLSHELRGPLGVMLNGVEVVKDGMVGAITEEQQELLKMVLTNGEHLLDLLNDVLDYARVEAGKIVPQRMPIAVSEMLKELVQVVQVQANSKKQSLLVHTELNAELHCDRRHFRQIFINILTNAVKYTPEGGTIEVIADRVDGHIQIAVKDNGCGIAHDDYSKVFSPFDRITHGYAADQTGAGLGMPLSKKLVEMNGGTIEFTSSLGLGTVFTVVFPEVLQESTHHKVFEDNQRHVVVLPNDTSVSFLGSVSPENELLVSYLKRKGCLVIWHQKTLDATGLTQPRVVVIDESFRKLFPDDTFQSIRKKLQAVSLPLLYLSRDAFNFSIEEQLKQGVDRFLAKPCSLELVFQEVARLSLDQPHDHLVH